jgi:hypothetical protein
MVATRRAAPYVGRQTGPAVSRPGLTLAEARQALQSRLQRPDPLAALRDAKLLDDPATAARLGGAAVVKPTVQISVANVSKDALTQAAWDKKTGEWKARATGGRRTDFGTGAPLYDHHLDQHSAQLGRRKQQSNFFLTINTNKRRFDQVIDTAAVEHALKVCFSDKLVSILTFGPVHPDTYAADALRAGDVIEKVEVKAGVETGPITGALHAHLYLTITHWSQLRINIPMLQDLFKQSYNSMAVTKIGATARPAVKIQLQPQTDWGHIIAHYLSKQVGV